VTLKLAIALRSGKYINLSKVLGEDEEQALLQIFAPSAKEELLVKIDTRLLYFCYYSHFVRKITQSSGSSPTEAVVRTWLQATMVTYSVHKRS